MSFTMGMACPASYRLQSGCRWSSGWRPTGRLSKSPCAAGSCWPASDGRSDVVIAEQLSVNRRPSFCGANVSARQPIGRTVEIAPGRGRKPKLRHR